MVHSGLFASLFISVALGRDRRADAWDWIGWDRQSELSDDDEASDDDEGEGDGDSDSSTTKFSFPLLDAQIRATIAKYDGAVFPKLNWTSPQVRLSSSSPFSLLSNTTSRTQKDAAWMIPGPPLKCQHPSDVYLLLKSSDFIAGDLGEAFNECVDVEDGDGEGGGAARKLEGRGMELVLKQWYEMPKSSEWRCFVRERRLIGSSFPCFLSPFCSFAGNQSNIPLPLQQSPKETPQPSTPSSSPPLSNRLSVPKSSPSSIPPSSLPSPSPPVCPSLSSPSLSDRSC